jgi:hypothetical protein
MAVGTILRLRASKFNAAGEHKTLYGRIWFPADQHSSGQVERDIETAKQNGDGALRNFIPVPARERGLEATPTMTT